MCIPSFGSDADLTIPTAAAASPEVWRSKSLKSTSSTLSDDAPNRSFTNTYTRSTIVAMDLKSTSLSAVQSSDM